MKKKAVILCLVLLAARSFGKTFLFTETTGSHTSTNRIVLSVTKEGFHDAEVDTDGIRHEFVMDRNYTVFKWVYFNPRRGIDYRLERKGAVCTVIGKVDGRNISMTVRLDNIPFYENWSLGMRAFILSTNKRLEFNSLNPYDPTILGRMTAEKTGVEKVVYLGKPTEAVHVRLTINGIPDFFYQSQFWIKRSDGTELKFTTPVEIGKKLERVLLKEY